MQARSTTALQHLEYGGKKEKELRVSIWRLRTALKPGYFLTFSKGEGESCVYILLEAFNYGCWPIIISGRFAREGLD